MSSDRELTYALDFPVGRSRRNQSGASRNGVQPENSIPAASVPRIARLMALAIRFEGLLLDATIRDYVELAQLGRVTRARITQIMNLLALAPDIQEEILFLPVIKGLNERNLRPIVDRISWREQRCLFDKLRDHRCSFLSTSLFRDLKLATPRVLAER